MIDDVRSLGPNQLGGARLELRNSASTSVALDGSWWPRTRDSAGELTALIRALEIRQAPVRLLMLNPHGWRDHPRRIELLGRSVRIDWIRMLDESVVIGATARGARIDLHLMMPAGGGEAAMVASAPSGTLAAVLPDMLPTVLLEPVTVDATLVRMIEALDGFGTEAPDAWIERVRLILRTLRADLRRYHDALRTPTGTYDRVVATAPRLSNAIANLECEHLRVGASLDQLLEWAEGPQPATLHVRLRNNGLILVQDLIRYRQHGADLLYQTDEVDLGCQG
jgi:hypothetical protein